MGLPVSIFDFVDFAEFLRAATQTAAAEPDRAFSGEKWAKRLGYRSPQSVTMVLSGRRLPSSEMVFKLADDLGLSAPEKRYFELLVHMERFKRAGKSVKGVVEELENLNPRFAQKAPLTSATFSYISEWYHYVIEQLVGTKSFREDAAWIRERLRRKVTEAEAMGALATMERLGILGRDGPEGSLARRAEGLTTTADIPSRVMRAHLRQMLERAMEALEEQDVAEREFTSLTLRFDKAKTAAAKQAIRDFREAFNDAFYAEDAEDVFQLNVQLFKHTP